MTDKLSPCPFCGGAPTLYLGKGAYGVKCTCDGQAFIHTYNGGFVTTGVDRDQAKANAIAAWNRRSPEPQNQTPGWQPIETAPTDGRDLIMTSTDWNGDILVGSFAFGKWRENPSPEGCSFTPTHWMPIPPLPTAAEGQP